MTDLEAREANERKVMETRRDSRTATQRQVDDQREREFHRKRREAGLPPVNYSATITITVRDVTDEEAEAFHVALVEATYAYAEKVRRGDDERGRGEVDESRPAGYSGSTYTTERSIYDNAPPQQRAIAEEPGMPGVESPGARSQRGMG